MPSVDSRLELADAVRISRDSEDTLTLCATERQDPVGQERKDDGNLQIRVRYRLKLHDTVQRFTVDGRVECRILHGIGINLRQAVPRKQRHTEACSISPTVNTLPRPPFDAKTSIFIKQSVRAVRTHVLLISFKPTFRHDTDSICLDIGMTLEGRFDKGSEVWTGYKCVHEDAE